MTSLYAYDAAYAPDLAKVKAAGGIAINGYLTGLYATSTTQPAAARAAGLGYVATYEEGPSELVNASRAAGQTVGVRILTAFKAKGLPLDGSVAVYPSADVNVANPDACNAAWRGIRDVLAGKVSVRAYAEGAVIDALAGAGLLDGKCWLAAPTSWPGYTSDDANVCMIQLVGTDVAGTDRNHIIVDPHALGAWWPEGSEYALMALDPKDPVIVAIRQDIAALAAAVGAANGRLVAILNGDTAHPDAGLRDLAPVVKATGGAVAKLVVGPIDPKAVAAEVVTELGTKLAQP